MSLRSLITDLKGNVKKTFSGVDTDGSLSNKFWQSKAANNLAKYQQSKIGQSHIKAGKATSKVLFKNPYEFGQQTAKDISDLVGMNKPNYQMRNAPNTGWKNLKTQVVDRVLPTASFIAGTGNPAGVASMTALGGGINYASNRVFGKQDSKTALSNTIPQTIEMLPKSFQMAGISRFTNPVIEKAGLAGKGFVARNAIKAPLNVGEGLIMDKATGMETTKESVLIDALSPALFDLGGMTFKSANDARIKAKYKIDETLGTGARKNGKYASLDQLLGKKGKGKTQALGLMAGIEPYQDEEGKWRVRFNKSKALIGLGLAYGGTKVLKGAGDTTKGSDLDDILKAQNLKNNADDLISEARKYKSAEEFIKAQTKQEYRSAHQLSLSDSITADKIDIPTLKEAIRTRNGYLNKYNLSDLKKLEKLQNNPDADITIYRASPKNEINEGDWVTTDKIYANDIKKQNGGKVYSYTVKVKDLRFPKDTETLPSLSMASTFSYSPKASQLTDIWNQANKVVGDIFSTKTEMGELDNLIDNSKFEGGGNYKTVKEYMEKYKGKTGEVVYMTPDEYLSKIPQSEKTQSSIDYMKKQIADGKKLPMPSLDYTGKELMQEGRNRAYLAKELGIEKIPVLVANKVGGVGVKEQVRGLDSQKVGKTQYTQQPLQETALPKSSEFPYKDSIPQQKLLPEGKPKVYTPNQAKAIFKRSGKQVPYKTTLKSGDSVINVPTGGWTGKKPYIEGKPITESDTFKISQWEKDIGTKAYKKGIVSENFPAKPLSSNNVRDKSALSYQTETILRNTEETFGRGTKEADSVKKYFVEPITKNETKKTWFVDKWKKDITTKFKNLGVTKRGSVEDMAAADFIEGNITKEKLLTKFKGNTKKVDNIIEAAEIGRKEYKSLLKQINDTITPYGYKPIAERQNYITHTKQISDLTNKFGSLLNIPKDKLPTEMSAINMDTKPGRQFFKFGQKRVGGSTHEGLITALDSYIEPASNQIFHTGDIQRGRAMVDYISKSSNGDTKLSNFNSYLSQYVDSLAGKKNVIDRPFEKVFGRQILNVGDWAKKRTGANMVGGNVSSALTNFIPFTESIATTSKPAVVKGLYEGLQSPFKAVDDIDGVKSEYLARNFLDKSSLFPKTGEKIIKKAGILFEAVDKFTKRSVVAGKYFENISKGLNPEDAMKSADEYAARALVDRSYGQTPIIFGSKTLGMFTQFQTEVNNQMSFLLKDIPKNLGYSKLQVASSLAQFAVLSYVFNNLYEKVTGRRPQVDVIHLVESYAQGLEEGKDKKDLLNPADSNTPVGELISNLPFNPVGGRLPVGAAIPNLLDVASGKSTLKDEMKKPLYYIVPPVGGGQIKKTVEGLSAGNKGYSETKSGDMRFLVPENRKLQTAVFGQYSTPEAREYFDKNRRPLSDKQSSYVKQASDKKSAYQEIIQTREKSAIETKIRDSVKESGKMQETEDKYIYWDKEKSETGSIKKNPDLTPPKLTGQPQLDKEKISDYKTKLSNRANDIVKLYELGLLTEEEAEKELTKIIEIKESLKITKSSSGSKAKKVNLAKISQKTLKPVKVQVKSPKFNTFEILNNYKKVKAPTIKAPNLKVIDFKTAKLKKGTK